MVGMPKLTTKKTTGDKGFEPYPKKKVGRPRKSYVLAPLSMDNLDSNKQQPSQQSNSSPIVNITSNPPLTEMNELLQKILATQCTKDDFKEFSANVNHRLSNIEGRIESNDEKLSVVTQRMDTCEQMTTRVQYQLEMDKQRQLKDNISVHGIPYTNGEDLTAIILKVFAKIGCEVSNANIAKYYRIKGNNNNVIIVKLANFELKQKILVLKSKHVLKLSDIVTVPTEPNAQIYINNHTTPFFGKLLSEGRKAAKTGSIQSCWLNNQGCQIKFKENGKSFLYKTVDELRELIAKEGTKTKKRPISHEDGNDANQPSAKK